MVNTHKLPQFPLLFYGNSGGDHKQHTEVHHYGVPSIFIRTEQGPSPLEHPTRPERFLDGSENIRDGFWVSFSGYFRVRVGFGAGVGSDKYTTLNSNFFFFWIKPYSVSSRLPQLSASLRARLSLCKSSFPCCCVCVCVIVLLCLCVSDIFICVCFENG